MSKKDIQKPFFINIICLGIWNKKLFTPNWISNVLLKLEPNIEFQINLSPDMLKSTFSYNNIHITASDDLFEIKFEKHDDITFNYAIEIYNNLRKLMLHSIISMGINIKYKFSNSQENKIFNKIREINLLNTLSDYV